MTIETESYVGVIKGSRAPNRHEASRFHYMITRKTLPSMLMVAGSAATEKEATARVQQYLRHLRQFADHDAGRRVTEHIVVSGSAAA